MARPEIIAQVHEARYELRLADGEEAISWKAEYEKRLDAAALIYQTDRLTLKQSIAKDYYLWVSECGLPHLRSKDER